jgi:tetratricopeptide (TPR) repeat protein
MESRRPTLPEGDRGQAEVMERTLRAAIWFAQGKEPEALEEGRRAAELEEGLPYEFGPPASFKPPRELLGELHLAQRRFSAARAEFERALARTPDRVQSLLGLARAASGEGAAEKAARAYRTLAAAWRNADADFAARREVEERLQGGGR